MAKHVSFRRITKADLPKLWSISFGPEADMEWMKFNGPYFNDPILTWSEFSESFTSKRVDKSGYAVICVDDEPVGMLSSYFEDGDLGYWLEVGLVVYDSNQWGNGIGQQVLKPWIDFLFNIYPSVQHIGFTTWSGNQRMMALGERIGMKLEGQIRAVRYWQGEFYDSMKYGILRSEME